MSDLHAVVFGGGAGERLWPLSRQDRPKQFTPLIPRFGTKSSFHLAVERLRRLIPPERIYLGTHKRYASLLREQAPAVPEKNFILEPKRRDTAAAVALAFFTLEKDGVRGPVIFQWSDHYVSLSDDLLKRFEVARTLIEQDRQRFIVIAEEPSFANDNLGWIELGPEKGTIEGLPYYSFSGWHYKPSRELCERMLASGGYAWNTGHFVTSVEFMTSSFRSLAPELAEGIEAIVSYRGTSHEAAKLEELYPRLPLPPRATFDDVFLTKMPRDQALLFKADLGWVDPGTLSALKEALQEPAADTATIGNVVHRNTRDSLIYNRTDRPVVVFGTAGIIVVEMADVTVVIDKGSVRDLPALLDDLEAKGLGSLR